MDDYWETPKDLFDKLNKEFLFDVDVCATPETKKCGHWFGELGHLGFIDALQADWYDDTVMGFTSFWMNPPYSRGNIEKFMEKAYKESLKGATVVCLVRFDPSAKWFQNWVDDKAEEVRMLARRVKFVGAPSAYNFPCCIVIYNPNCSKYEYITDYYIWDWK